MNRKNEDMLGVVGFAAGISLVTVIVAIIVAAGFKVVTWISGL